MQTKSCQSLACLSLKNCQKIMISNTLKRDTQLLMKNQHELADERVDWFLRVFGRDRFSLEVQPEDQKEQKILNDHIFALSKRKNVQLDDDSFSNPLRPVIASATGRGR